MELTQSLIAVAGTVVRDRALASVSCLSAACAAFPRGDIVHETTWVLSEPWRQRPFRALIAGQRHSDLRMDNMEQKWTFGLWGAVGGALALLIIGLASGMLVTSSKSETVARQTRGSGDSDGVHTDMRRQFPGGPGCGRKARRAEKGRVVQQGKLRQRGRMGDGRKGLELSSCECMRRDPGKMTA